MELLNSSISGDDDHHDQDSLISSLPKAKGWIGSSLTQYQGFWCPSNFICNVISFQKNFDAHNQDIILATFPKSGTTWLKAIISLIVNRHRYTLSTTPLLTTTPHQLVPFLEINVYSQQNKLPPPDLSGFTFPRLFATHIPYNSLPDSVMSSNCKIVYICRNPLDVIVSFWHFSSKSKLQGDPERSLGELVDSYCKGEVGFGPFWKHILEYWRESVKRPEKIMFLMYEDLKKDTISHVKKLADFIGFPFSSDEEKKGVIEGITEMCSLSSMKDMEVNKTGKFMPRFENKSYFRKGEVGDWVNYLSPSMVKNIDEIMGEKFGGSGLIFKRNIGEDLHGRKEIYSEIVLE